MEIKRFPGIGETLYTAALPSGLRVNVVPKPGFQGAYAILAASYGSAYRRFTLGGRTVETPAGTAHYLEHKMFDRPEGDDTLERLAANGAEPNAFTGSDITAYHFQCTEKFEENLRLLLRFAATPHFTREGVERERGIITQEILMEEDEPGSILYYDLLEQLFPQHPLRDRVLGTVESIALIDENTLELCRSAFYAPSNMTLCVEGDVDPERVLAIAAEELPGEVREAPVPDFGEPEGPLPAEPLRRRTMPVSAPQFLIGAKFPAETGRAALRQRLTALLALRLLAGRSSGFYARLYGAGLLSRDFDYEADLAAGMGTLIFGGESGQPEKVLAALNEEIARIGEEGLDPDRFERARRASLGARLRGLEDFENVCFSLAMGQFEGYCALDAVELLGSVTKDQCEAFLLETLRPERLALSILEPERN